MKRLAPLLVLLLAVLITLLALLSVGPEGDEAAAPTEAATPDEAGGTEPTELEPERRRRRRGGQELAPGAATEAAETAQSEAPKVEYRVRVRDARGRPIPGLRLERPSGATDAYTGADGVAVIPGVEESDPVSFHIAGLDPESRVVTEPLTDITLPRTIPLSVELVDGETGATVSGGRFFLGTTGRSEVEIPPSPTGGTLDPAPLVPAGQPWLWVRVEPPSGYAGEVGGRRLITTRVSRFAERYHVRIPLRPESSVTVLVEEPDGSPAEGATVSWVSHRLNGVPYRADPADAKGRIDVRGIPFLRGEKLTVQVEKEGRSARSSAVVQTLPNHVPEARVRLPAERGNRTIGFGGGAGGAFGSRRGYPKIEDGTGRIEVSVKRRNGQAARSTKVVLNGRRDARTDGYGRAVFEGLGSARYVVEVQEPGFVPSEVRLTLEDAATGYADITESDGWAGRIVVKHADGLPARFAEVELRPIGRTRLAHLENDVQQAVLLTDIDGVLAVPGLGGRVQVKVEFGSRRASGFVSAKQPEVVLELQ